MPESDVTARLRVIGETTFKGAMRSASSAMKETASAAQKAGSIIMSGLTTPLRMLNSVGGALSVGGLLMAGKSALDMAVDFDTSTRRIAAFTGSMDEARKAMKFLEELSGPSIFGLDALAKAGALASAYGLNLQRVIPMAESIATAMGDDANSVLEVTRALGRLKSGDFGEAFERLRDFGISKEDLQGQGLKFDKSGAYKGSVIDAMNAVEKIVDVKFGAIRKMMADSPAAKIASTMDAGGRAMKAAGEVIMTSLLPPLAKVTDMLDYLTKSGIIAGITQGFVGLFGLDGGGLQSGMAWIAAGLERLPELLKVTTMAVRTLFSNLGDMGAWVVNNAIDGAQSLWNIFAKGMNWLSAKWNEIKIEKNEVELWAEKWTARLPFSEDNSKKIAELEAKIAQGKAAKTDVLTPWSDKDARSRMFVDSMGQDSGKALIDRMMKGLDTNVLGSEFSDIGKRADAIMEGFGNRSTGSGLDGMLADGRKKPFFSGAGEKSGVLEEIADNTGKTASNTNKMEELRRFVVGGGERANSALGGFQLRSGGGAVKVQVAGSGDADFDRWFAKMLQRYEMQKQRVEAYQ